MYWIRAYFQLPFRDSQNNRRPILSVRHHLSTPFSGFGNWSNAEALASAETFNSLFGIQVLKAFMKALAEDEAFNSLFGIPENCGGGLQGRHETFNSLFGIQILSIT